MHALKTPRQPTEFVRSVDGTELHSIARCQTRVLPLIIASQTYNYRDREKHVRKRLATAECFLLKLTGFNHRVHGLLVLFRGHGTDRPPTVK